VGTKSLITLQHFQETIAAGERKIIYAYSRMLTILENSASDDIKVGIGEMLPTLLRAGLQYELPEGDNFDRLAFENQSGSSTTVKFILSMGRVHDNRLTITGSVFSDLLTKLQGDTTPETVGTEKTVGTTPAVEVIASNTDRKGFSVQAKASNTGIVYIGFDNTVTTTKWVAELQPGMSFGLDNYRGDVYAIADTAAQLLGFGEW